MTLQERVPVLVIGGGIVGLSATLFLLQQDIPFLLIERRGSTSIHPRTRGFHFRAMELFRELGLEEVVRTAGEKLAPSQGLLHGKTLLQALATAQQRAISPSMPVNLDTISPTTYSRCTLDVLEPILVDTIRQRGGTLRYNTELVSLVQDDDGVTATIVDRMSGNATEIRASYIIAADGAASFIRSSSGIPMSGRGTLGHQINIYFQANLRDYVCNREFSMCQIQNAHISGLLTAINNEDRWTFHTPYVPQQGEKPQDFTRERCAMLLHTALGLPSIELNILSILPWEAASRVADHFQIGERIFLAGDAAHQMPPTGGFGASTGIEDVHNLTWKLAAVLRKQADAHLLQTYADERRPVAVLTAEQAALRSDAFAKAGKPQGYIDDVTVIIGYHYASQAVIAADQALSSSSQLLLDGRPGTRAPHITLQRQGVPISSLDLFGRHFVLLTGSQGHSWREAAQAVARQHNLDIDVYLIDSQHDLTPKTEHWQEAYGIMEAGAVLVRPDGFVAWRTVDAGDDPQGTLEQVFDVLFIQHSTNQVQVS